MRRKKRSCYAVALALTIAASGCGRRSIPATTPAPVPSASVPSVLPGKETVFALPYSPTDGFDPMNGTSRVNLTLSPLLYQGLFSLDARFRAEKELCESYTVSPDGLAWSFTLASASFSDGSPLTPELVVSSLERSRKSERYSARLAGIQRITAAGETVVITLSSPNGALPALLDTPVVKENGGGWPLGTGDYVLSESNGELSLTARTDVATPLKSIPLRPVGDSDDLIYAFDAGEIALVDADLTGGNALGYSCRFETTDYPATNLLYVGFNSASGPCRDEAVRRALARALDRESVTGRLLAGHGVASALPVHPYAEEYDSQWAQALAFDMETARELLTQAGWSPDEGGRLMRGRSVMELRLLVNQDSSCKIAVAEALMESLGSLGCAVTLEKLPWEEFIKALERRDFDLYLGETAMTADFDLEALLGSGGALNYGGYGDQEMYRRMAAHRAALGEDRKATAAVLYERWAETEPLVPLCFKNGSLLTQWGRVSGAAPTQRNVFSGLERWRVQR